MLPIRTSAALWSRSAPGGWKSGWMMGARFLLTSAERFSQGRQGGHGDRLQALRAGRVTSVGRRGRERIRRAFGPAGRRSCRNFGRMIRMKHPVTAVVAGCFVIFGVAGTRGVLRRRSQCLRRTRLYHPLHLAPPDIPGRTNTRFRLRRVQPSAV